MSGEEAAAGGALISSSTTGTLSPQQEERYFTLSMTLLRSLQQSNVRAAMEAAEEMNVMLSGALPPDSPARLLLAMKGPLEEREKELQQVEEEDEDDEEEEDNDDDDDDEDEDEDDGDEEAEEEEEEEEEQEDPARSSKPVSVEAELEELLSTLHQQHPLPPVSKLVAARMLPIPSSSSSPKMAGQDKGRNGSPGRALVTQSRPRGCSRRNKNNHSNRDSGESEGLSGPTRHRRQRSLQRRKGEEKEEESEVGESFNHSLRGSRQSNTEAMSSGSISRSSPATSFSKFHGTKEEAETEVALCQEDLAVLLKIEEEVSREMQRLAIIRRNR